VLIIFKYRHIRDQGHAEIAVQSLPIQVKKLDVNRLIRPSECGCVELLRRRIFAGQDRGGIARAVSRSSRTKTVHPRHHGDGGEDAAKQIPSILVHHKAGTRARVCRRPGFPQQLAVSKFPCHCALSHHARYVPGIHISGYGARAVSSVIRDVATATDPESQILRCALHIIVRVFDAPLE